jgi:hypothetical protein
VSPRILGLLLIAGAAFTLALHFGEAPEGLYRWLYHHLPSGLDVPADPSPGTVDAVRYTSLAGGLLELAAGVGLLGYATATCRSSARSRGSGRD